MNLADAQVNQILREFAKEAQKPYHEERFGQKPNTEKVSQQFQALAPQYGRNNALYQIALQASRLNVHRTELDQALIPIYVETRPYGQHPPETQQQRIREGKRTIQSAYAANGTATYKRDTTTNSGRLPTAIREEILKATATRNKQGWLVGGSTIPGRLLEALLSEGVTPGKTFTIKEAQQIGAKYKISPGGVYNTLRGKQGNTPTGKCLFSLLTLHPPPAGDSDTKTINQNYSSYPASQVITISKSCVGRQTKFKFVMPSHEELCLRYDVIPQSWDDLSPADLSSPTAYRQALHREYVGRVSPEQSVIYLANRLGCHPRTIYRYDVNLGVQTIPVFGFTPLEWANVDNPHFYGAFRYDGVTPGKWLQRSDGKRFPARKGIALQQLTKGETLVGCERRPSKRILSESLVVVFAVIWRRSDLPVGEWDVGGDAHSLPEFGPAVEPLSFGELPKSTTEKIRIAALSPATEKTTEKTASLQGELLAAGSPSIRHMLPHPVLDELLTAIPGIGPSRRDHLFDLGIFTLSDLVNADAEWLASTHWYGGYVTGRSIRKWQEEAAIMLGWKQRDPDEIKRDERQLAYREAKKVYRHKFATLMKFVQRAYKLIDAISHVSDIPDFEPTRIFSRLKHIEHVTNLHTGFHVSQVYRLATDFFAFFHEYIAHFLSLKDWQLDEYGFGSRPFWEAELHRLERVSITFAVNELDQLDKEDSHPSLYIS
jgi:predicted flap endonuclease-1-like 5' DNA nuclease